MTPASIASQLADLHFLRPQWLWLLLMLPILMAAWQWRRQRRDAWRATVDPHLLPHLLERSTSRHGLGSLAGMTCGLLLATLALAGPSWRRGEQPLLQASAPLVIALDLSSASLANDVPPSRLLQARQKIATLLTQRAGGQVALVAFAGDAYTVAPLTDDADNVALFLDALAPDVMPVDGSNAAHAIEQASRLLKQAGFATGDILILGDHADLAARDAAASAHAAGYRISALGLGSARGAAYRTANGAITRTRLDAGSLRALATAGGGNYAPLSPGTSDLSALGVLDASRPQANAAASVGKVGVRLDEGYWMLLPLMVLVLFAFRRGGMFAVLVLCACLPLQTVHAQAGRAGATDAPGAGEPVEATLWRRGDQVRHARMEAGAEAYRKQDFEAAGKAWSGLSDADAAYNQGNALAKAGKYEAAIDAYDQALQLQPGMADAVANRSAVEAAMKRKPPAGDKKNDRQRKSDESQKPEDGEAGQQKGDDTRQPPGKQDGKGEPSDGDPDDSKQQAADQQQQESSRKDDGGTSQAPPRPADADRQHDADTQQRQRMQQALQGKSPGQQQSEDGKPVDGEPAKVESAAQREKRQADEAWLRRVPDDPGGLLRTKFLLEHERRQQTGEE